MKSSLRLLSTAIFLALPLSDLNAADFHVSPSGKGTGTSESDSAAASEISEIFNDRMSPGDRLLLAPGEYKEAKLDLLNGGTEDKPKTIEAKEGAVFVSSWTIEKPDRGATAILLAPGLSHTVFKNISISNYCFGVVAKNASDAPRIGLKFENVTIEQMRHGFYLSDCDSLELTDCVLKRYSKHGYRFEQGCNGVVLKNCLADCSEGDAVWETKTELLPFGFNVNNGGTPNSGFLFEDCVSKNNIKSNQKNKYTNGDGFVVEGNTTDVTFNRCRALRNQDGGFDLKVDKVTLTDCVSTHCRRSFRLWKTGTLKNCFSAWSTIGVWAKGGPVTVSDSTLVGLGRAAAETEGTEDQPITLRNCIFLPAEGAKNYSPKIGNVVFTGCISEGVAFNKPVGDWDGAGPNYDSKSHPDTGYSSGRISRN